QNAARGAAAHVDRALVDHIFVVIETGTEASVVPQVNDPAREIVNASVIVGTAVVVDGVAAVSQVDHTRIGHEVLKTQGRARIDHPSALHPQPIIRVVRITTIAKD